MSPVAADTITDAENINYDSQSSHDKSGDSIKGQVFQLLDQNPLLMPKHICRLLHLNYTKYRDYVTHLRSAWKYDSKKQRGSKCSVHGWRGWTFLPARLDLRMLRGKASELGWRTTASRNRWLLWKEKLGRLQWFETGRVNLYVRKPATLGRAYQLVCNGFSFTGLITDIKVLEAVLKGIRFKSAHYVFETKQSLPKLTIDLFRKSSGIVVKVGDVSHPTAVEVIASYPDWAERNERLYSDLTEMLRKLLIPEPRTEPHKEFYYLV